MRQDRARQRIDAFMKYVAGDLKIRARLALMRKSEDCSHVDLDRSKRVVAAVADSILDESLADDPFGVNEYDFVEALVHIAHEAHHSAVLQGKRDDKVCEDIKTLSESYASRIYNSGTYDAEYGKFTYEIAAERYALKTVRKYAETAFPMLNTDDCLMDYIRAKTINNVDKGVKNDDEPICPYAIPMDRRYRDMDEVLAEFDLAYDASLIDKKDFRREGDLSDTAMKGNERLSERYGEISTGRGQAALMAGILREYDPKSFDKFSALRAKDYDIGKILDKDSPIRGNDGNDSLDTKAARALDDLRKARDALDVDDIEDDGHGGLG